MLDFLFTVMTCVEYVSFIPAAEEQIFERDCLPYLQDFHDDGLLRTCTKDRRL
jgi:hypothetical protein